MKIPQSEIKSNNMDDHPVGDFPARVTACVGQLSDKNGYELRVTFTTKVGKITQFWNTKNTGWKIKIFQETLGFSGDFDTDDVIGKDLDLKVTKKEGGKGQFFINVETHVLGTLVEEGGAINRQASTPPVDAPF
jgi:hypothetical protein